jgi:hypothetical protein
MEFSTFLRLVRPFVEAYGMAHLRRVRDILRSLRPGSEHLWHRSLVECAGCSEVVIRIDQQFSYARSSIGRGGGVSCYNCFQGECCCSCERCNSCGMYVSETCEDCYNCPGHCSCNRCARCGDEPNDSLCSGEGRCENCCRCDGSVNGIMFSERSCDDPNGENEKPTFHTPDRHQLKNNPSPRYLSPEIEIYKLVSRGRNGLGKKISKVVYDWGGRIVHDGSLGSQGFEINPAPAGGDLFLLQMKEIFSALEEAEAYVNEKCGMHVHINARDFTAYDIRRLVKYYAIVEDVLFGMVDEDRRENDYCRPCAENYMKWINKPVTSSREIRTNLMKAVYNHNFNGGMRRNPILKRDKKTGSKRNAYRADGTIKLRKRPRMIGDRNFASGKQTKDYGDRYQALNLVSWFYRGTVECRLFPGTVDYVEATNWCMMWACILDFVFRSSDNEIAKLDQRKKKSALLAALAGRDDLIKFVEDRLDRFSRGVVFDDVPVKKIAPVVEPPSSNEVAEMAADLRSGTASLTTHERMRYEEQRASCFCNGCSRRLAEEFLNARRYAELDRINAEVVNVVAQINFIPISEAGLFSDDNDLVFEETDQF